MGCAPRTEPDGPPGAIRNAFGLVLLVEKKEQPMRTDRTGYLMAMLAGLAIVGASTGGVVAATSHHNTTLAAEQVAANLAVAAPSPAVPSPAAPSPSTASPASSAGAGSGVGPSSAAPLSASAPAPLSVQATPAPSPPAPASSTRAAPAPTSSVPTKPASIPPAPVAQAPVRTTAPSKAPGPTTAAAALKYKNGQYTATGSYNSPGGTEKLGVTITLAADKVVKSDLNLLGGAGLSHSFQQAFQSGYSGQVIGKDIDAISVGAVSGSSLTSMGFNDALKQIESQAKT
jgi:uncharacterized protein with FMN-binding domain